MVSKTNLMTIATQERLQKEFKQVQTDLKEAGRRRGDAFGPNCDWHDNAAADFAVEEFKRIGVREEELKTRLQNVEIIKPQKETGEVALGNAVIVRMGDSDEDEVLTVLGSDDSGTKKGWISYESPVGGALIGMTKGEVKTLRLGHLREDVARAITITVKQILPGDF
ncbi:hypothetical protein COT63_00670 [Candidatus Shapirobacteria bacterium CG09_land_8_20_14_0_10_38_17]|uniref:Transcription elongation factor GreA/GreB C-terminal domain-containing protein n=1 Tax=Candidatus Shapirobacteria bacterium CG09_land_8_20_14_0_10_38_17 TaxID=1974884 RepID=A0A2H0WRP7_9BACT|nr:MAG: hypothetical protein COT63_00670 [Candidatus Shapirobacteria bacterium CG09_land_8_20_14_0_10_38_17]